MPKETRDERIASMLRVMDSMEQLRQTCAAMGLTFRSEVTFTFRCEHCDQVFEDPDDCEAHEESCR